MVNSTYSPSPVPSAATAAPSGGIDFNQMLGYLQNLLTTKQGMQGSEFGQNLDLQNRSLAQRGQEFDANLGLQTQSEKDAAANLAGQLGLATTTENNTNKLGTTTESDQNKIAQGQLALQNFLARLRRPGAGGAGGGAPSASRIILPDPSGVGVGPAIGMNPSQLATTVQAPQTPSWWGPQI